MLFHGVDKVLHGPGETQADLLAHGLPAALGYGVYVAEVVAPILILVGAWTRLASIVYSLSIAFATLLVHGNDFLSLTDKGGWAAETWAFYILSPMAVFLLGPGRYAVHPEPGE